MSNLLLEFRKMELWIYLLVFAFIFTFSPILVSGHYNAADCSMYHHARDCRDLKTLGFATSGVYHVTPVGTSTGFDVYCDMTVDKGGWTVFQRRQDGSVEFRRNWTEYESGFGDLSGEHWLGNLPLYTILYQGHYELRVDLEDWDGIRRYARYLYFKIGGPVELYKMTVAGYSGDAGDALSYGSCSAFSTADRDNDTHETSNCAQRFSGAFWYRKCMRANLNGLYLRGNHTSYANGVNWYYFRGFFYSLKTTEMKIRRV